MHLISSSQIQQYVQNNKKEAEIVIPEIIRRLLLNTVEGLTGIDVPSGDNVIQTGFDGVVSFVGYNKYLGDKPVNIEIGTDADYLSKANKDISKRIPKQNENFIFITPYCWNKRTKSKDSWVDEKKVKYGWNDIKIIDAEVLECWLEEDLLTSKYLLNKMNVNVDELYSIADKEKEFIQKTKKGIGLDFFNYEDKEYDILLSNLKKEYYNIMAPTREEGLFVTLYYLKQNKKEDEVLIIDSEVVWNELISKDIIHNTILIPNFYYGDGIKTPCNNITIFIHDVDELSKDCDYSIKNRTISNLRCCLELYYKEDNKSDSYEVINDIIKNTLGKYIPLKRKLFKNILPPIWFEESDINIYLMLFLVNNFKNKDMKLFAEFQVDIDLLKEKLNHMIKDKDPYIVYYEYWDEYRVVNNQNAIEFLGNSINENILRKYSNILRKVLFYLEPKYLPENIDKKYYFEESNKREYSKTVRTGILKSLILTKLYLKRENKYSLIKILDDLVMEYYGSIKNKSEYLNFSSIADKLVEFDYDMFLNKVHSSVGNFDFEKMFNLENKDTLFSTNEYCNIIWAIEKSINKSDYISKAVDTLVELCEIKEANYKNMANTPFNTLKEVFLGWDNLTCLTFEEKISLLKRIVSNHSSLGKKLLKEIFPVGSCTWSPLLKPEYDCYDDVKSLKYIVEQKAYFEAYYNLYLDNYAISLDDLVCIYEEVSFIEFDCFEKVKLKTMELIKNSNDEEKFNLKEEIGERLRGYKKFHNNAWDLNEKQFKYLNEIFDLLNYNNPIYDYIHVYRYRVFLDDDELRKKRLEAMNLLVDNEFNENFLLLKCDNKVMLIYDIYEFVHNKKANISFLIKLFLYYKDYVHAYLRGVYNNESLDDVISLYNKLDKVKNVSIEDKVFVLANYGFNEQLYEIVRNTAKESIYWKKINIFNTVDSDFVYNSCLKYQNYEMCLDIIYEQPDKYDEKCYLLEKIKESGYNTNQLDEYKIEKIFESFHGYSKVSNFERLAKLEVYFTPILKDNSYFLSREASKYPSIVVDLAEIVYKNEDGIFSEFANNKNIVSNCYSKLHNLKIDFNTSDSLEWCEKFLELMKLKRRSQVMFHILGQLLARAGVDEEDKMFPSKNVRKIIEFYKSDELASSFKTEKYNQRGVHYIGIGEEEFALYKKYLDWSKKMRIDFPETSKILKSLAETYRLESNALREEANYVD